MTENYDQILCICKEKLPNTQVYVMAYSTIRWMKVMRMYGNVRGN